MSLKKGVGSGVGSESGSICPRYGSADPDPHQNVTDPQHCIPKRIYITLWTIHLGKRLHCLYLASFCRHSRAGQGLQRQDGRHRPDHSSGGTNQNVRSVAFPSRLPSVADPDAGSGTFWTPGSGIRNRFFSGSRISDPGSQTHIFQSIVTIFWVKTLILLWKLVQNFFFSIQVGGPTRL